MSYRIIQIHVTSTAPKLKQKIGAITEIVDSWAVGADGLTYSLLVKTQHVQRVTDRFHDVFSKSHIIRMVILPVEAVLPKIESLPTSVDASEKDDQKSSKIFAGISRAELYDSTSRGASLNSSFIWLVIFSTIVAAIGLIENNVAVIIGAMVIAPLLGPNLALALSSALGDVELMIRSLKTMAAGFLIALSLSFTLGAIWPYELDSFELLSRTKVGFDSIALALVSGGAAVLSMATGLSSVLVGVMVAVALLPPCAVVGIMLGAGEYDLAMGAGLLLAVNIVCVNLSAKLVFLFKGVGPRTWYEKKKAKKAMIAYLIFWGLSLAFLAFIIYQRGGNMLAV